MTLIADRYRLDREIGRGGMGTVWLAEDVVLGRQVAVKQIGTLPGATEADLDRVGREARVSAMLNHEHVVVVFDLVTEGAEHWLVMEYVESETLAQLVARRGALPLEEVVSVAAQAATALAAAHDAGIVHRDVKPSNLLVSSTGHVKLSDFGIARAEADMALTQTGLVVGSPGYLAPEVALGSSANSSSDMWSLGATIFFAAEGHPPYDMSGNVIAALYRIVNEEPPWAEHAGWLAPMVRALMDREPEQRWSAAEVRDFLHAGPTADEATRTLRAPVVAEPVPLDAPAVGSPAVREPRRESWVRRNALLLTGLVAAVVLVGFVIALYNSGSTDGSGSPAAGPTSNASTPAPSKSATGSPAAQNRPTAAGMTTFVKSYLATAPRDPHTTFDQLTTSYQQRSGGFSGYEGFWGTVTSVEPTNVQAYPDDMTVSFLAEYKLDNGERRTDGVTLHLTYDGKKYLIDDDDSRQVRS